MALKVRFELDTDVPGFEKRVTSVAKEEVVFWVRHWRHLLLEHGVRTTVGRSKNVITIYERKDPDDVG